MLVDNKELKELGKKFIEKLIKLPREDTIVVRSPIATTDMAKLIYGDPDLFWLMNKYNRRFPKNYFDIGEKVSYPSLNSIDDLIETFIDKSNKTLVEKSTLPL